MTELLFSAELATIRGDYVAFLAKLEAIADDHSPGAIFRRARRASMADATKSRRWKARALDLNPEPNFNAVALSGMAPIRIDERWLLGVALPQPSPVGGLFDPVDDVLLIDPRANTATMMGDDSCTQVGPACQIERLTVTNDPKAWARDIALHRLEWYRLRKDRQRMMQAEPTWTGEVPTALLLATPKKVRWSDFRARILDVPADMRVDVQRAMFAQARLPRIEGRA